MQIISGKVKSIAATKCKGVRLICINNFVDIAVEWSYRLYFEQLVAPLNSNNINEALILAADKRSFVDHSNRKDKALRHNFINNRETLNFDHVKHFFFSADEDKVFMDQAAPHILNIKSSKFLRLASSEHINFVLTIHSNDVITAYSVYVPSSLTFELTVNYRPRTF